MEELDMRLGIEEKERRAVLVVVGSRRDVVVAAGVRYDLHAVRSAGRSIAVVSYVGVSCVM